ncbi:MAG: site-specific DNA-methyltransferase, partial [candidate division Zixibacteria bacterium]|nr:site-specific DNA-methyltransferase [candidate division Zixibacteria bacterium]
MKISDQYNKKSEVVLYHGDCLDLLKKIPDNSVMLVVTSPPYNLGKEYEKWKPMKDYLKELEAVIAECVRILHPKGSICWQVGNYVQRSEVFPLDILLYSEFKK